MSRVLHFCFFWVWVSFFLKNISKNFSVLYWNRVVIAIRGTFCWFITFEFDVSYPLGFLNPHNNYLVCQAVKIWLTWLCSITFMHYKVWRPKDCMLVLLMIWERDMESITVDWIFPQNHIDLGNLSFTKRTEMSAMQKEEKTISKQAKELDCWNEC